MQKKFDSSFKCAEAKDWLVDLTMSKVLKFCRENKCRIEQISPTILDSDQLARLCFLGCGAEKNGYLYEEFVDEALSGEVFSKAMEATAMAIINFTLPRLPEANRAILIKSMEESLAERDETNSTQSPSKEQAGLGNDALK